MGVWMQAALLLLVWLLCSALGAHVHGCDIAADGGPDGGSNRNSHGDTNLVAHGCAYCSAHSSSNRCTHGITDRSAVCSSHTIAYSVPDSSSMRRWLARMS